MINKPLLTLILSQEGTLLLLKGKGEVPVDSLDYLLVTKWLLSPIQMSNEWFDECQTRNTINAPVDTSVNSPPFTPVNVPAFATPKKDYLSIIGIDTSCYPYFLFDFDDWQIEFNVIGYYARYLESKLRNKPLVLGQYYTSYYDIESGKHTTYFKSSATYNAEVSLIRYMNNPRYNDYTLTRKHLELNAFSDMPYGYRETYYKPTKVFRALNYLIDLVRFELFRKNKFSPDDIIELGRG